MTENPRPRSRAFTPERREFAVLRQAHEFDPARFLRFRLGCREAGWVRRDLAEHLRAWPGLFHRDDRVVTLSPLLGSEGERTEFQKPNPFPKSIYENVAYGPLYMG